MAERGILMSAPMVRATLDGTKTVTRRVVKYEYSPTFESRRAFRAATNSRDDFVTFSEPYTEIVGSPVWFYGWGNSRWLGRCPYGRAGDFLYVRETWALPSDYDPDRHGSLKTRPSIGPVCFKADYSHWDPWPDTRWRPSIHMPKWAARIWLRVTDVRVERVQEITPADVTREGVPDPSPVSRADRCALDYEQSRRNDFSVLWDSLNASRGYGWGVNPWVWVVEFERCERPEVG